tara:strand:- start:3708 stop:4901 length:1194 start_codon:yes stop_codon:yes gene_type:complete
MIDITIVGGGIVGLAAAYELLKQNPSLKVILLEKESKIGQHQSSHNSGVIHSGIYYRPGSLKAMNCRRGIELLMEFCNNYDIPYNMCGKVIVATGENDLSILDMLHKRGRENGISGLKILSPPELQEYEPFATGLSALYCPETGIIDYLQVSQQLSANIQENGKIETGATVISIDERSNGIIVTTETGEYETKFLINCAGLFSDQIAELAGAKRQVRIIPFRGEYYILKEQARHLVKNLIYPIPDPRYPFLGVHFTRTIGGEIEAGPNAVLAWAREGYKKTDIDVKEMWDYLSYGGFWRMAGKYWDTALGEFYRSFFKAAFVDALQKLVPEITADDILPGFAGVRAQALTPYGGLIDDFVINNTGNMIHVINAPSPAATSSLAIGEHIASIYSKING